MLHSICQQIWKTQQRLQDWKRSVFLPVPQKGMPKNVQTTAQLHSFYMLAKWCSKFSKLGFSSTWTKNSQMFKLDLEKTEEPEIKLPISAGSSKKWENSRKTSTPASLTVLKPLAVWITANCGKFFERQEYQTTLPDSCETCVQVKKQQLEPDMEQWLVPNGERSLSRLYIVTLSV